MIVRALLTIGVALLAGAGCRQILGIDPAALPAADAPVELESDASIDAPADAMVDAFPAFEVRINIGGPAHAGVDFPGQWAADPGAGGICGPSFYTAPAPLVNTNDAPLFLTHVFNNNGPVNCKIPGLPAGTFEVTMLFGNTFFNNACPAAGDSVFDIALEGTTVLSNFKLTAEAGGCMASAGTGHPVAKVFTVGVIDGELDIVETKITNAAEVSAIQVIRVR